MEGDLAINSNTALASLNGLENLTTTDGSLTIQNNTVLVNFCAIRQLITDKEIAVGEYSVITNAYNSTYLTIKVAGSNGCEQ